MEQTKEQKAIFFAQYYMQPVQCSKIRPDEHFLCKPEYIGDEWYLSLRSVKQLTDDELKNVIDRYNKHYSGEIEPIDSAYLDIETGDIEYYYPNNGGCCTINFNDLPLPCTDYLRLIGICLSDTAVKNGWVKLKED